MCLTDNRTSLSPGQEFHWLPIPDTTCCFSLDIFRPPCPKLWGIWGIESVIRDLPTATYSLWWCFTLLRILHVHPALKWHARGALGPADSRRTYVTSQFLNPIPCLTLGSISFGQVSDKFSGCIHHIDISCPTREPWAFPTSACPQAQIEL